jgi:ubiquinone/menaquinone biosynthesis C-methylase UbiE
MVNFCLVLAAAGLFLEGNSFVFPSSRKIVLKTGRSALFSATESSSSTASESNKEKLMAQKLKLFKLIGPKTYKDPVLADPITKEEIEITASGSAVGSGYATSNVPFQIRSPTNTFRGSSGTYLDLLEPVDTSNGTTNDKTSSSSSPLTTIMRQAVPYIPPNLRGPLSSLTDGEFIPMRDLFTNPAVSYAYERGWRQGFAAAGFPGPDTESVMAMDYFAPVVARVPTNETSVVVDMSCATGLFTRRFALSEKYGRVLGCDYSPSMLAEARRRIDSDPRLSPRAGGGRRGLSRTVKPVSTQLTLVRLDVGQIPMQTESVHCLHAGAAMHCWPDLNAAASEIYRVLKPGGRYFATTFLSTYFSAISSIDGQAGTAPSQQAFQYFESVDTLRELLVQGGFEKEKIMIEVLGTACVVIRAEK